MKKVEDFVDNSAFSGKKIVATRFSDLAQHQTEIVCQWILRNYPSFDYEILGFSTQGDRGIDRPLKEIGGKGAFVKELQQGILQKHADLAVHSMKDLPLEQAEGLCVAGFYAEKEMPFDVLVSPYKQWENLPQGSCIGTSSLRRAVQFLKLRPDCKVRPLRGNVLTRLGRLSQSDFDGLILAEAGLNRLNFQGHYDIFDIYEMVPAFNQGLLGIECRSSDEELSSCLVKSTPKVISIRIQWERKIAQLFKASCKSAIGIYAHVLSCEPLRVHLYIFACKDWDYLWAKDGIFSDLEEAVNWTQEQFHCETISWAICHVSFT